MSLKPDCELRPSRNASVSVASDARCGRSARVWRACRRDRRITIAHHPSRHSPAERSARSRTWRCGSPSVCWRPARSGPSKQGRGGRRRGRVAIRPGTSSLATAWLLLSVCGSRLRGCRRENRGCFARRAAAELILPLRRQSSSDGLGTEVHTGDEISALTGARSPASRCRPVPPRQYRPVRGPRGAALGRPLR